MTDTGWLWAAFTLIAALAQTARNAMQRELTATLGTVGATHVRFLFGFPFAILFLIGVLLVTGRSLPRPGLMFWLWLLDGAGAQVLATALMLAAMGERSFVVAYAYIKTEPVQIAAFGLIFLGDALSLPIGVAIVIATAGVMVMSMRPGVSLLADLRPVLLGVGGGTMFALSAIGYRGAILSLDNPSFLLAATFTVTLGLVLQAALLSLYLALRDAEVLRTIARAWRPSLFAGFMGAFASEFWFLAFALTTAANVRTLGLIEVLFAQLVSVFIFGQRTTPREALGIVLVVLGVMLLLWAT
ncbi:MAG: EamA family transporter [Rhizobiales bacterium]|nr:EamA family transporter [Hyphomicrobiales bacterium]